MAAEARHASGPGPARRPLLVVAIGGNALLRAGQPPSAVAQFENALETAGPLLELRRRGFGLVITHGNGPQIGAALLRSELAAGQAYPLPYDCCVAQTQGEIGYVLQYALWQRAQQAGLHVPVVTVVTQVRVDARDPAFSHPSKPVGPFYSRERGLELQREHGFTLVEEKGRGFRRVVPSPRPREIVELDAIRACLAEGLVVIAAGGGGVPVFNDKDTAKGVEAVIDKDLTSAVLACQLGAERLVILTAVDRVALHYGTPDERPLDQVSPAQAREWLARGQFPEGSMGPKIEAALLFLERGGRAAVITDAPHLLRGVEGEAGTRIAPDRATRPA